MACRLLSLTAETPVPPEIHPDPALVQTDPSPIRAFAAAGTRLVAAGGVRVRSGLLLARAAARAAWARPAVRLGLPPVLVAAAVLAGAAHHLYWDRSGVPPLDAFVRFEPPMTGEIEDAQGQVLIEIAREYRRVVRYDEIPPVVREAILATEDKNFFSHSGIDYTAFPRVVWKTFASSASATWHGSVRERRLAPTVVFPQGGSTLTQQLVRGYFLRDMTSREDGGTLAGDGLLAGLGARALGVAATNKLARKIEEIRLSLWLEGEMTRRFGSKRRAKEEILARYASFIYMGNGRYGFAAASLYYFNKPLAAYTAADAGKAALLAGITKSPRDYAPAPGNLEMPRRRRNEILASMADGGALSQVLAARAQAAPIVLAARSGVKTEAPAVVEAVFDELRGAPGDAVGVEALVQGRIRVRTTVDNRIQRIVNDALEAGLAAYEKRHPRARGLIQGSVVVLANADGGILAEAGGRKVYRDRYTSYSDFNRVTGSRRQPGSAMKPIVYLTAFLHGTRLDSMVWDEPIAVPTGTNQPPKWIHNYDGTFKGPIPVRQALAESRNAATIHVALEVGIDKVIETARELGVRTPLQPYITTALGASEVQLLELANAYRAIASGVSAEPHVIFCVSDASGRVLLAPAHPRRPLGVDADALLAIQEGLRGVVRLPDGTAHALDGEAFGIPVMGKTGTTSDFRDALFVGSTYGPEGLTVAVRLGFDDNREMGSRETGSRAALPVFRDIVRGVYARKLRGPVPQFPDDMEQDITAYLASAAEPALETDVEVDEAPASLPALQVDTLSAPALLPLLAPAPPPPVPSRGRHQGGE